MVHDLCLRNIPLLYAFIQQNIIITVGSNFTYSVDRKFFLCPAVAICHGSDGKL